MCGEMTSRANSLVPMGAGLMVGLTARPYFTRRGEMLIQLLALRDYSERRLVSRLHRRKAAWVSSDARGPPPLAGDRPPVALAPRLLDVGQITAKGSAPGKDVFATDYVPPLRGKRSTVLPYETMHPQPKPVPQRPPTKQCPAHNMGACPTCLAHNPRGAPESYHLIIDFYNFCALFLAR